MKRNTATVWVAAVVSSSTLPSPTPATNYTAMVGLNCTTHTENSLTTYTWKDEAKPNCYWRRKFLLTQLDLDNYLHVTELSLWMRFHLPDVLHLIIPVHVVTQGTTCSCETHRFISLYTEGHHWNISLFSSVNLEVSGQFHAVAALSRGKSLR